MSTIAHCDNVQHQRKESLKSKPSISKHPYSSRRKHFWSLEEMSNLREGVEKYGVGNWVSILENFRFQPYRNNVSLKDKWRNLVKNHKVPMKYWK